MDKPINRTGVSKIKAHHFENGASNGHLILCRGWYQGGNNCLGNPAIISIAAIRPEALRPDFSVQFAFIMRLPILG
jgi:hypothetical protein